MLNKTNIIYVFNPILLTNVFATDLRLSNLTILSKNDTFVFHFLLFLNSVELSSPASLSHVPCVWTFMLKCFLCFICSQFVVFPVKQLVIVARCSLFANFPLCIYTPYFFPMFFVGSCPNGSKFGVLILFPGLWFLLLVIQSLCLVCLLLFC